MTEDQFKEVTEWQNRTFKKANPLSKAHHLEQEVGELKRELTGEVDNDSLRKEIADCFILLFGIASLSGMTHGDVVKCIDEKMAINYKRKWGQPDENGVVNHLKGQIC